MSQYSFQSEFENKTRQPTVAGKFYPGNSEKLFNEIDSFFKQAKSSSFKDTVRAIIVPHAGYIFSGQTAAEAYSTIDATKKYKRIFILGISHSYAFKRGSIYNCAAYETPLGKIWVDRQVTTKLLEHSSQFHTNEKAHLVEHSIEVQVPFIQYIYGNEIPIVPILLGTRKPDIIKEIASVLLPYFTEDNLFIVSADFSHYPGYDVAVESDKAMANAVISNNFERFIHEQVEQEKRFPQLSTACCSSSAILCLLHITHQNKAYTYHHLAYTNSGDQQLYGDKSQVVGYNAFAITSNADNEFLTDTDKKTLLSISKQSLQYFLNNKKLPPINEKLLGKKLLQQFGAFVSIYHKGKLRGCIGTFEAEKPLYKTIQEMAVAAATRDSRFDRVDTDELEDITFELSVLTPMLPLNNLDDLVLGKHGIYIEQGFNKGTFLPQVATKTGWTKKEFLGHCARDKAHIGWNGWKLANVFTYEAIIIKE